MKRIAWIILGVVVLSAWVCRPVAAQDDAGLEMSVTAGFDGYCHADTWCPVYIVLSNEGADIEGELRVSLSAGATSHVYAKSAVLPAHSRKAYFLYLPFYGPSTRISFDVKLFVGKGVLAKSVAVSLLDASERLYGVASSAPSALNFLSNVTPTGRRSVVAYIDLGALPPDPLAWEGLDVLVLNDVDTTVLSSEQRYALGAWVAHGGHLIVGGGAGAARTAAGMADLLPVSIGGTRSVNDLRGLGEYLEAPVAPGPYAVAEAVLQDGETLVEQDGLVLAARRVYGDGEVSFLAFDAGLNPFVEWNDNLRLWQRLVEGVSAERQRLTVHNPYQARTAVDAIPGLKSPSTLQILGFLLLYTILIGPVNYVVLRKLDRRELAWVTIPALILGFSACAYVTGFQLRGFQAIVHRMAVVYVPQGSQVGRVTQLVGLFSPRRAKYDVWMPGMEVRGLSDDNYYYGGPSGQSLHVFEAAEGATVTGLWVDVGGIEPFVAEGYTDVPGVEAALRLSKSGGSVVLEGTARNGGVPLKDAVLIVKGRVKQLGDLEPGEEIAVQVPFQIGPIATPGLSGQILGTTSYWDDPHLLRRYSLLEAIFSSYYSPYSSGPSAILLKGGAYLIGWSDEDVPLSAEVVGSSSSTLETALYVYALPMTTLGAEELSAIPLELALAEVVSTTGYVERSGDGFYLNSGAEVTLRFSSFSSLTVRDVDEIILDVQGSSGFAPSPVISIWDWEVDDWRTLDVGWGRHSIPYVGSCVSPSGDVLLRLEATDGVAVDRLTLTIKGQQ